MHKFSTLNVDCRDPKKPVVNFQLFIDEKISWELKYLGKPVKEEPKQLGQLLPTWDQFLNLIKRPIQWFSEDTTLRSLASSPPASDLSPETPSEEEEQLGEPNTRKNRHLDVEI